MHKKFVQILNHFHVHGQPIVKSLLRILWRHCICWLICWGSSCADCAWSGDLLKLICCLEAQIVLHNVLGQAIPIWCYRSLHSCAWHGMAHIVYIALHNLLRQVIPILRHTPPSLTSTNSRRHNNFCGQCPLDIITIRKGHNWLNKFNNVLILTKNINNLKIWKWSYQWFKYQP